MYLKHSGHKLRLLALISYAPPKSKRGEGLFVGINMEWVTQSKTHSFREQRMLHIKGTAVSGTMEAIVSRAGKEELARILAHLDEETKKVFHGTISPSSWYSCDAFARFLEADIRETAGGNEQELIKRSEAVIERQLHGIYRMFVRLGSPEFVIRRIAAVHSTYFDGVQIIPEMHGRSSATLQYVGFSKNHRILEFVIIGFFKKALEISGAKKVDAHFSVAMDNGEKFCELVLHWE